MPECIASNFWHLLTPQEYFHTIAIAIQSQLLEYPVFGLLLSFR